MNANPTTPGRAATLRWDSRRNCALSPRQVFGCFGALCAFSGPIALVFAVLGYPWVALFFGVELAAFAAALLFYARHACDGETLTLHGDRLRIEQRCGERVRRIELPAARARVSRAGGAGELVVIGDGRACVAVGRHLPSAQRAQMADALRVALQHARVAA